MFQYFVWVAFGICLGLGMIYASEISKHGSLQSKAVLLVSLAILILISSRYIFCKVTYENERITFSSAAGKPVEFSVPVIDSCTLLRFPLWWKTYTFNVTHKGGKKDTIFINGHLFDLLCEELPKRYGFPVVIKGA